MGKASAFRLSWAGRASTGIRPLLIPSIRICEGFDNEAGTAAGNFEALHVAFHRPAAQCRSQPQRLHRFPALSGFRCERIETLNGFVPRGKLLGAQSVERCRAPKIAAGLVGPQDPPREGIPHPYRLFGSQKITERQGRHRSVFTRHNAKIDFLPGVSQIRCNAPSRQDQAANTSRTRAGQPNSLQNA